MSFSANHVVSNLALKNTIAIKENDEIATVAQTCVAPEMLGLFNATIRYIPNNRIVAYYLLKHAPYVVEGANEEYAFTYDKTIHLVPVLDDHGQFVGEKVAIPNVDIFKYTQLGGDMEDKTTCAGYSVLGNAHRCNEAPTIPNIQEYRLCELAVDIGFMSKNTDNWTTTANITPFPNTAFSPPYSILESDNHTLAPLGDSVIREDYRIMFLYTTRPVPPKCEYLVCYGANYRRNYTASLHANSQIRSISSDRTTLEPPTDNSEAHLHTYCDFMNFPPEYKTPSHISQDRAIINFLKLTDITTETLPINLPIYVYWTGMHEWLMAYVTHADKDDYLVNKITSSGNPGVAGLKVQLQYCRSGTDSVALMWPNNRFPKKETVIEVEDDDNNTTRLQRLSWFVHPFYTPPTTHMVDAFIARQDQRKGAIDPAEMMLVPPA
ncbi:hypothetical protein CYMTET_44355 [Cymbomonas tetramitiformis]|uniref:Uncharacterized protein n=1 Tax=Cymbomonas tetramitiformis TaxID=36881 RepID=A0AAE0C1M8_9CHLO|nr:hypothetical protein CYMTET_44355 [Cymbomonas tetramitiformis]